jgi:hypothetical protein
MGSRRAAGHPRGVAEGPEAGRSRTEIEGHNPRPGPAVLLGEESDR